MDQGASLKDNIDIEITEEEEEEEVSSLLDQCEITGFIGCSQ